MTNFHGKRTQYTLILFIFISICMMLAIHKSYANTSCHENINFNIGAARYDITGPAAEEGMMGYGKINQQTSGIYQRLWARAFVIESPCNGKRIAIVNTDLCMIFQGVTLKVIEKLQARFGNLYTHKNVLLTAIHNHSGPGGFSTDPFYNITTFGFYRKHFDVIVDGIVESIALAHNHLAPATIKFSSGELTGISFNRSPQAYLSNPQTERDNYHNNVDTVMTLLRFDAAHDNKPIGIMNWFPLHGVSMNNKNHLITSDNKGYAAYQFEKQMNEPGIQPFIAGFLQANAGDVSPNPLGHEGGLSLAGLKAIKQAGLPQYKMAKQLFDSATEKIKGGVDYRQIFIKMDNILVEPQYTNGQYQRTCPAAIGISMLAGTQDGEGIGKQGRSCSALAHIIPKLICKPITTVCQGVKPIVLPTGSFKPHPWTPNILPLQIIKIGNMVIASVPFEITTMVGRRIIKTIKQQLADDHIYVVLSTLANAYAGYVTTPEEYQLQRYEGASNHFGPWTSAALMQEFAILTRALLNGEDVPSFPAPHLSLSRVNLQPNVFFDHTPPHTHFGDVYINAKSNYARGDTVVVTFWGAHPKNNFHIQSTFLTVEHFENGKWNVERTDNDWDTEYHWKRHGIADSLVTIVWRIPKSIAPGTYRITHSGDYKLVSGKIIPYTGYSSAFIVRKAVSSSLDGA